MTLRRREFSCKTYDAFRERLDDFDPDFVVPKDQIHNRWADRNEWDFYLRPGTEFDNTCRGWFDEYPGLDMTLITHKSDIGKLKRIEALQPGRKLRILWSDAS